MPKFILIEHSIRGMGGHYYEYARHVLEAAEEAGFAPILVTNRQLTPGLDTPWPVYPLYHFPSGEDFAEPCWLVGLRMLYHRWRTRLLYSRAGLFWALRSDARSVGQASSPAPPTGQARTPALRLVRLLSAFLHPGSAFHRARAARRRQAHFARDTVRLLAQLPLSPGDQVLLATMSEVELAGLTRALRRFPAATPAAWHLVFRRNFFPGRTPPAEMPVHTAAIRRTFQACADLHRQGTLSFYSDTEELAAQYRDLTGLPFGTLPIPHTRCPPAGPRRPEGPLVLLYLGDARAEKGFHHLPRLVGDLWRTHFQTHRLVLIAQSNFNTSPGEPAAVVARRQLETFPSDKVILLQGPLPSEQYRQLLTSAGINLLLYDREAYYARSSGILAESLAAGLPVLVPAGTWLSRQIVDPIYRHRLELARVMTSLEIRAATDLPLRTVGTPETTPVRGKDPIAGQGKNGVMAELDRPPAADFLLISFALEEQTFDPLVEVALDQHDQAGLPVQRSSQWLERGRERSPCAWLVPLRPETRWLVLAFRNPLSPSPILLVHLQAQFLHASCEAASLPTGQVGLVYTTLEDIPALVAEMVEHWPHYRETAAAHAAAWVQLHNAQRLLECLDTRHPARPPVPHRAGLESVGGTR